MHGVCCPICGMPLRSCDLETHYTQELEYLSKLSAALLVNQQQQRVIKWWFLRSWALNLLKHVCPWFQQQAMKSPSLNVPGGGSPGCRSNLSQPSPGSGTLEVGSKIQVGHLPEDPEEQAKQDQSQVVEKSWQKGRWDPWGRRTCQFTSASIRIQGETLSILNPLQLLDLMVTRMMRILTLLVIRRIAQLPLPLMK